LSTLFFDKLRNFIVFSSTGEGNFGFDRLILKQKPLRVLLGFTAMMKIENQFFTDVCYVQHGTSLAHATFLELN